MHVYNLEESTPSFHHVDSGNGTGVIGLEEKHLYLLSHLTGPLCLYELRQVEERKIGKKEGRERRKCKKI